MYALTFDRFGGPEVLRYQELPDPVCQPGEVLVRTAAIGLNPADLFPRENRYEPQSRSYFHDWQILHTLRHDALVVLIAARTMLTGKALQEADVSALSGAVIRIHEAANFSRGASNE